jgi:hypothetical protein
MAGFRQRADLMGKSRGNLWHWISRALRSVKPLTRDCCLWEHLNKNAVYFASGRRTRTDSTREHAMAIDKHHTHHLPDQLGLGQLAAFVHPLERMVSPDRLVLCLSHSSRHRRRRGVRYCSACPRPHPGRGA